MDKEKNEKTKNMKKLEGSLKKGGLNINDDGKFTSIASDILKQLATKIMEGNMVDLLKISRPARLTSPTTHLIGYANDLQYTDLMVRAARETDPLERMKLVSSFILGGLHVMPKICKSKAPLNPVLGETYQAHKKDGCSIFLEQTSHHPPTSNFLMLGPEKCFEIIGFAETVAKMTGLNSIKGYREGKSIIKFKDGTLMTWLCPEMIITGVLLGDRMINFAGQYVIKDYQNKIESTITFPFKDVGNVEAIANSITKLFASKQETEPLDNFIIQITKLNKTTKKKELISDGYGSWLGEIVIDDKKYWSFEDNFEPWNQDNMSLVLPSDSTKRVDLHDIERGDFESAQKNKEKTENIQRNDKKLRENEKNQKK